MTHSPSRLPWIWFAAGVGSSIYNMITVYLELSKFPVSIFDTVHILGPELASGVLSSIAIGLVYAIMLKNRPIDRNIVILGYIHLGLHILATIISHISTQMTGNGPIEDYSGPTVWEFLIGYGDMLSTPIGFIPFIGALVLAVKRKPPPEEAQNVF